MKKPMCCLLLLSLIALLVPQQARAGEPTDDTVVLSDLTYLDGLGLYYFDVSLSGSRIYTAYNMDIFLPEGFEVAKDGITLLVTLLEDEGLYPSTYSIIANKTTYTHTLSVHQPQIRQLRVACYSSANEEFTANTGSLFRVYVTVDEATLAASFSPKPIVTVSGIALTQKEDARQYDPADFTYRPFSLSVVAERTLPLNISAANQFGTLILPFAASIPEGVKAYTCSAASGETLILTAAESFEACTPYIVYAENGYSGTISGTVNLAATYPAQDVFTSGYLTGVLTTTVVNTGYIMQNKGDGAQFYNAEGRSFSLPAGRCYLTPGGGGEAKAFRMSFDEETAISEMMKEEVASDGFFYDLVGRRVTHPVRGLYIQNKKKIFIQ